MSLTYTEVGDYKFVFSEDTFGDLIFDEYGQSADLDNPPADPQSTDGWDIAYYALAVAEDRVETFLRAEYNVPFEDGMPPSLKDAVLNIAKYGLYKREGEEIPSDVKTSYEDTMKWLMKVEQGEASVNLDGDAPLIETGELGQNDLTHL
jgi:phage gp36-like protein